MASGVSLLAALFVAPLSAQKPDSSTEATALVHRALVENRLSLEALRNYIYIADGTENEYKDDRVVKTTVLREEHFTIDGEPVARTLLVNGQPPSDKDRRKEEKELDEKMADARDASPKHKAEREKKAAKALAEEMDLREDVANAYNFTILGEETREGHRLVKIAAEPKESFKGKSRFKELLLMLHGTLLIDATRGQWIDIDATMVRKRGGGPLYLGAESAIHLHQAEVADGLWCLTGGSIRLNVRLLFLHKNMSEQVRFHDFRRFGAEVRVLDAAEAPATPAPAQANP